MKIISLFAGAGGLDLGFEKAGFDVEWANEYDNQIWETYEKNHKKTILDKRSLVNIPIRDIPNSPIGVIGGPPCQSWSEAGALRGINDKRGQLFFNFIEILRDKQPLFFLAENVSGMLLSRHKDALTNIKEMLKTAGIGYRLSFELLNVVDYGIPQDRKRVFFIGFRNDLNLNFKFPEPIKRKKTLKDAIHDLKDTALPALEKNHPNENCNLSNHEYMTGSFSSIYMSRNRVRSWDEPSFTIQAGGRHAPLHPQAPKMTFVKKNKRIFQKGKEQLYRRLSVRECARIQTFPDSFRFYYDSVSAGYKMIGNAVPVEMGRILAKKIITDLKSIGIDSYVKPKKNKNLLEKKAPVAV